MFKEVNYLLIVVNFIDYGVTFVRLGDYSTNCLTNVYVLSNNNNLSLMKEVYL